MEKRSVKEILKNWEKTGQNSLERFKLDAHYGFWFTAVPDANSVLEWFEINRLKLELSTDSEIYDLLEDIDKTLFAVADSVRDFIINTVFTDISDKDLIETKVETQDYMEMQYTIIKAQLETVSYLLNND